MGETSVTFKAVGPISSGVLSRAAANALVLRLFGVPRWVFFGSRGERLRRMHQAYRRRH